MAPYVMLGKGSDLDGFLYAGHSPDATERLYGHRFFIKGQEFLDQLRHSQLVNKYSDRCSHSFVHIPFPADFDCRKPKVVLIVVKNLVRTAKKTKRVRDNDS
jgi:hypothetical protein